MLFDINNKNVWDRDGGMNTWMCATVCLLCAGMCVQMCADTRPWPCRCSTTPDTVPGGGWLWWLLWCGSSHLPSPALYCLDWTILVTTSFDFFFSIYYPAFSLGIVCCMHTNLNGHPWKHTVHVKKNAHTHKRFHVSQLLSDKYAVRWTTAPTSLHCSSEVWTGTGPLQHLDSIHFQQWCCRFTDMFCVSVLLHKPVLAKL